MINIEVKDFVGTHRIDSRGNTDTNRHGHRRRFPIRSSSATIEVVLITCRTYTRAIRASRCRIIRTACYNGLDMSSRRRSAKTSQISTSPTRSSACLALSTLRSKRYDLASNATFIRTIKRARDLRGYSDCLPNTTWGAEHLRGGRGGERVTSMMNWGAMTYEILEEIAKYLGCTFTHHGGSLHRSIAKSGYHKREEHP